MSKLDRFLISEGLIGSCPNISAITLARYLSDYRPILMCESYYDYGHIHFRFFHYWFEIEGFDNFVEGELKYLLKKGLKADLVEIDLVLDKGESNYDVIIKRTSVVKSLQEVDKLQSLEVAKKAKIKWVIKGYENSK